MRFFVYSRTFMLGVCRSLTKQRLCMFIKGALEKDYVVSDNFVQFVLIIACG